MSLRRSLTITTVAATLLAACTMVPEYQRPAAPVPTAIPNATSTTAGTADLATVAWRDYFGDDRLRALIDVALANNRDLRIAGLNIKRARAQYQIQQANLYPMIGATGSENAQRLPGRLAASGESTVTHVYTATVGFNAWELDFFGRIRSLNEQALEEYLATEEARRSAQITLVAEVARTWLVLAADRERLALARNTYETRQRTHDLIRRSFEAGGSSALDVAEARTLMEGARSEAGASGRRRRPGRERARAGGRRAGAGRAAGGQDRRGDGAAGRRAGGPDVGGPRQAAGRPAGGAAIAGRERQHRCGAGGVLPARHLDRGGGDGQRVARPSLRRRLRHLEFRPPKSACPSSPPAP